jgi:hypothetical protein
MLVDKGEARKKQKLKIKEKKMAKPNAEMVYGKFNLMLSSLFNFSFLIYYSRGQKIMGTG